ncbi:MAG: divalent-cation tolerance protein CutA [Polyangiales bacterium]
MSDDAVLVVLCTVPTAQVGTELARKLVGERLAACVNLLPAMQSFYEWQGELHEEPECQLVIKTRAGRFDALRAWLTQHHPYDEPEILALPVARGSPSYLDWVRTQTA